MWWERFLRSSELNNTQVRVYLMQQNTEVTAKKYTEIIFTSFVSIHLPSAFRYLNIYQAYVACCVCKISPIQMKHRKVFLHFQGCSLILPCSYLPFQVFLEEQLDKKFLSYLNILHKTSLKGLLTTLWKTTRCSKMQLTDERSKLPT